MRLIFAVAGVMAMGAGAASAQDTSATDQQGNRRYKIVGQVVSSDPGARTITLRSVSRRQDGTRRYETVRRDTGSSSTSGNTNASANTNTSGNTNASGNSTTAGTGGDRNRDGSFGAMASGESITVSATGKAIEELDDYKAGDWVELTCADGTAGTAARTTTGTTTASASTTGTSGDASSAHARFGAWVTANCGTVMDIDGSRDPMGGTGDRR